MKQYYLICIKVFLCTNSVTLGPFCRKLNFCIGTAILFYSGLLNSQKIEDWWATWEFKIQVDNKGMRREDSEIGKNETWGIGPYTGTPEGWLGIELKSRQEDSLSPKTILGATVHCSLQWTDPSKLLRLILVSKTLDLHLELVASIWIWNIIWILFTDI